MSFLRRISSMFSRTLLAGILAIFPLVITVAVVIWVSDKVGALIAPDTRLGELLQKLGIAVTTQAGEPGGVGSGTPFVAYAIGWVFVLTAIFVLGMLVRMGATSVFQKAVDQSMAKIPLMGGVYGTAKQLISIFDKDKKADIQSMSVVFCNFGEERGASFLALMPTNEKVQVRGKACYIVLVPTAPVPMGGSLLFVPEKCVESSDLTVDAFMSIYVSMGITGPQFLNRVINGSIGQEDAGQQKLPE